VKFAFLSHVNASLNFISAVLLAFGYVAIKRGKQERHRKFMIAALISSALFLTSYLIYHANVGSVPYPHHDWTRPVYFTILIPHVTLAGLMVPFIIAAVYFALEGKFRQHTRITRWLWPVWMFVSISGVIVYVMLYHL
jgi:putative membrane protein